MCVYIYIYIYATYKRCICIFYRRCICIWIWFKASCLFHLVLARALVSVADARSSPSCVAVPEYRCQEIAPSTQHALRMYGWLQRCQEIAPSTQHAPCSYAPGRIVERPLPRDSS